jgi:hypothetical protein
MTTVFCPVCLEHTSTLDSCCQFLGDDVVAQYCGCKRSEGKTCGLCRYLESGKLEVE